MADEKELSDYDGKDLMDEIRNREILGDFDVDELIEALASKRETDTVEVPCYYDFVVAVERETFTHGSGKKMILIVEVV
jgi:hypothetical protein